MKTLKEVSDIVGMSRRVIQEYEKSGLAETPTTKNKYGYLLYDQAHIDRLWQIRFYRELGYEKRQIQELLDSPGCDKRDALKAQIHFYKKKKMELENMIAMAETVEETGISPTVICSGIPFLRNQPYNVVIPAVSTCIQVMKEASPRIEACLTDLHEETLEPCWELLEGLLLLKEDGFSPESEKAQNIIQKLHTVLSPLLGPSIILLSWVNLMHAPETGSADALDDAFFPGTAEYLYGAIQYYCLCHESNPTDRAFLNAVNRLIRFYSMGLSPEDPLVLEKIQSIHRYFSDFHLVNAEGQLLLLECFGKLFGSDACRDLFFSAADRDPKAFIDNAIQKYMKDPQKFTKEESL